VVVGRGGGEEALAGRKGMSAQYIHTAILKAHTVHARVPYILFCLLATFILCTYWPLYCTALYIIRYTYCTYTRTSMQCMCVRVDTCNSVSWWVGFLTFCSAHNISLLPILLLPPLLCLMAATHACAVSPFMMRALDKCDHTTMLRGRLALQCLPLSMRP
jgi:hypothetical protein